MAGPPNSPSPTAPRFPDLLCRMNLRPWLRIDLPTRVGLRSIAKAGPT